MLADTVHPESTHKSVTLEPVDQETQYGLNVAYSGIQVREELKGYKVTCVASRNPLNEGLEFLLREEDWPHLDLPPLVSALCQKLSAGVRHVPDTTRTLRPGELNGPGGRKGCVGHILPGLRADIMRHRKRTKGAMQVYHSAIFFVDKTNECLSHRQFSVGKRTSFELAYTRAVGRYSEVRELSIEQSADALLTIPQRSIFRSVIEHQQLLRRDLPVARLLEEVGLPPMA